MNTHQNRIRPMAETYAQRGWRVIAIHRVGGEARMCSCHQGGKCPSAGKHPVDKAWQNAAFLNDSDLEDYFGGDRPFNIGIATGRTSGIFVVDIDPKDGGWDSMRALGEAHGTDWARGYRVQTGSGGVHLYFQHPDDFDVPNSAGTKLGPGIDVRGNGGQVVAPPSISGVGEYSLAADGEVPVAPDWLLDALRPKVRKAASPPPADTAGSPNASPERHQAYVDGALAIELGRLDNLRALAARPGEMYVGPGWDSTTFEVAANLMQLAEADWNDLTHDAVETLIFEHAPKPDHDGWTDDRIQQKIDSARRKVEGDPTPPPADASDLFSVPAAAPAAPLVAPATPAAETQADDDWPETTGPTPPTVVEVDVTTDGTPVVDGVLDPTYVSTTLSNILEGAYSAESVHEVVHADEFALPRSPETALLQSGNLDNDLDDFHAWLDAALVTGTPALFWAAVKLMVEGRSADAPDIILQGADELLRALCAVTRPPMGPRAEILLLGPTVGTSPTDDCIVIEFRDIEPPDVRRDLAAISQYAITHGGDLAAHAEEAADGFDGSAYVDFRAAQRARRKLGLTEGTKAPR